MKIISKIKELKELLETYNGEQVGLVPTMGALHKGHESLIKKSVQDNEHTVVSIFVNPSQFCQGEDFEKYPRTLEKDALVCKNNEVDIIFTPNAEEMYGSDYSKEKITTICPSFFDVDKLCGKSRVGHFDGVATVVGKLFNIVRPKRAYFGRKDAQQLYIIKKMVKDLNFDIEIVPCPIIREDTGLALSSRNSYLSAQDKIEAQKIIFTLKKIKEMFNNGIDNIMPLSDMAFAILPSDSIEYFEVVNSETFEIYEKTDIIKPDAIALIAVKINGIRLIDNIDL